MSEPDNPAPSVIRLARCPICAKPAEVEYRPFCSKRCADVDLNRWLGGGYAIPAADDPDTETEDRPDFRDQ
jgi:uncharacterized protein